MPFRVDTKTIYSILKLRKLYDLKSYPVGPNNGGIFLILPVTTGEGIGPAGKISPVVCMLKNGLFYTLFILCYIIKSRFSILLPSYINAKSNFMNIMSYYNYL